MKIRKILSRCVRSSAVMNTSTSLFVESKNSLARSLASLPARPPARLARLPASSPVCYLARQPTTSLPAQSSTLPPPHTIAWSLPLVISCLFLHLPLLHLPAPASVHTPDSTCACPCLHQPLPVHPSPVGTPRVASRSYTVQPQLPPRGQDIVRV